MANSPSRPAAATLNAPGSESGAPTRTTSRKPVSAMHSNPKTHGSGARPRRSSITATTVVVTPASRNTGTANTFVSAPCSLVTIATDEHETAGDLHNEQPKQRQHREAVDESGRKA